MERPKTMRGRPLVWGEGPRRPKYIIVGEAPGENEEREGRPFVGADGHILDGMLASAGIDRKDCYITNVVKVKAPQSKIDNLHQIDFTVEEFIPILQAELEEIECDTILASGRIAINALASKHSIENHRGSIYDSTLIPGRFVVGTYNPGFVRELWAARGTVVQDLLKLKRVARGMWERVTFNTLLYPSLEEVQHYTEFLLEKSEGLSYDLEVFRNGQIACVGIGGIVDGKRSSMCIPLKHGQGNYWEEGQEMVVWELLRRLFHSNLLKVGQMFSFDMTFLHPFVGEVAPPWFDIGVAHHTLDPELPHDLAYLTSIYTDVPYYKSEAHEEGETWSTMTSSEQLWTYNGKDVEVPLIIQPILQQELVASGLQTFFQGYVMPLTRVLFRLQNTGLLVDQRRKDILLRWRLRQLVRMQRDLEMVIGHPINVNSPKQIMDFVYNELKLPVQYHRKTRRPTVNEEALEKLHARYPNPAFDMVMDLRGRTKVIGTYLTAKVGEDGRMKSRYNVSGTKTGRSSSTKTPLGEGLDMQNVPEDLRTMFVAPPHRVLLNYDLWQAETWGVAVFARCLPFLEKLRKHEKVHKLVASWIYGIPENEIDNINQPGGQYFTGKRTNHAAGYGLAYRKLATIIKMPESKAKEVLNAYHNHAPEIEQWHREIQDQAKSTRKLTTPFGRVRFVRGRLDEDTFRQLYAHVPQSTIADYLHQAMVKIGYTKLPGQGIIVQEGYDAVVIEVDEDKVGEVDAVVKPLFEKELFWKGTTFTIPVDYKEGRTWGK